MAVQEQGELRPLSMDEAVAIAARHGITVRAKPIAVLSYVKRDGGRVARLYLPFYIVHVEVNAEGKERAWVERAMYCENSCDCGGDY